MPPVSVTMVTPEGDVVDVPAGDVAAVLRRGFRLEGEDERLGRLERDVVEERNEGLANEIGAGVAGFARGLTFGGSDVLAGAFGTAGDARELRELQDAHRGISTVAEIGGAVLPALVSGGASAGASGARVGGRLAGVREALRATPAGRVAQVGEGIAARGAAAGGLRQAGGYVAAGALEGAAGNAGMYLSDVALGRRELSAEGFIAATGQGALFGGAAGGAALGIEKGTIAARKLLSKASTKGDEAMEAAEAALERETDSAFQAGEDLQAKARDMLRQRKAELQLKQAELGVAREEQKLATQRALDEIRINRAKDGPRRAPKRGTPSDAPPSPTEAAVEAAEDIAAPRALVEIPRGFHKGTNVAPDAPVYDRMPDFDGLDPDAVYVVHPRDIVQRGIDFPTGKVSEQKRLDRVRRGLEEGHPFEPIEVVMKRDGTMEMVAGRHRLTAAAQLDRPVVVRFDRHAAETTPLAQKVAAFEDAHRAARDWVAEVRGGIAKRAGGTFTPGVRAPTKAERAEPGATHFHRTKLQGRTFDEAGQIVDDAVPAMADDVVAYKPIFDQELADQYDDLITRAAVEADGAAKDALLREAADLDQLARDSLGDVDVLAARERAGLSGVDVARRLASERGDLMAGMSTQDAMSFLGRERRRAAPRPMSARQADEAAFTKALRGRGPEDVSLGAPGVPDFPRRTFVDEAYESVEVIGAYERAAAELVEELGDAAPPAAKKIADGYRGAVDDQARKVAERTAQAADDAAEAAADTVQTPAPKRRRGKKQVEPKEPGRLDRIADIAAAAEALQTAGIPGIPDVDQIPVVGPMLGLWLKTRAARNLLFGRGGGRVAATAENRAAAMSARVRDRAVDAVDSLLDASGKAAKKGRGAAAAGAPRVLDVLRHRLYDDGTPAEEPQTDVDAALARIDELAAAQANPAGVRRAVRRALADASDPDLVRAAEAVYARKIAYLAEHMPKEPPPTLLGDKAWRPSRSEIESFAARVRAAEDPVSVLEDLARGEVSEEAAETLRAVYPEIYAEASNRLLDRAAELEEELPYQRVLRLAVLFDAPLVESLLPERIAALQAVGSTSTGAGATVTSSPTPAGLSRAPDLDRLFMTASDRRAMRR